ncbi:uncharacterized protein N7459_002469 [Penicillium hispanicum]|uniref:uncharacterized protein n=1 Tax=Penicillium hispanicum TaxID=1080232 RepID=UPI00253F81A1|nr:uncharacterized protein N7459_002469 [Penicillium hispanicum]KAJ5586704.1 hypothetical protein N7459_002469 [Penicillium hispanicum]
MTFLADLRFAVGSAAVQQLIPIILLTATHKKSILRYLAIPCMFWIARQNVRPMDGYSQILVFITGQVFTSIPQAINLLLINPLEVDDLVRENPGRTKTLTGRFLYAHEILSQFRGVGTPRQVKGIPAHPAYYHDPQTGRVTSIGRFDFMLRQFYTLAWQYAIYDIIEFFGHRQEPVPAGVFTDPKWNVSGGEWVERILTHFVTWFLVVRICIDSRVRLFSILHVGLGLSSPLDWPPMFGRMADAYTLRNFWGVFWHQNLRQSLTAVSSWITRDVMHLPRPSVLERYSNIFLVFLQSGLIHVATDATMGIPARWSGAVPFFTTFTLGIMIEDGVQSLYRTMSGSEENGVPKWKRGVGFLWVVLWLGVTSTWFIHPGTQSSPPHSMSIVPYCISERIGFEPVAGFAAIGGLALIFGFEGEI